MKRTSLFVAVAALVHFSGQSANADLPNLTKEPWFGYFIGFSDRDILLGITTKAEGVIHPLDSRKKFLRLSNPINFDFQVLEQTSDEKVVRKTINIQSLATEQEAEINPEKPISFTGKVTGDAAFAVTVAHDRGGYHFSGSVTDKGTLTDPLEFGIDFKFDPYLGVSMNSKDDREKFEKMARRDELEIVTTKGEKVKFDIDDEVDFQKKFPEGISSMTLETVRYGGTDFKLIASTGSKISFVAEGTNPVHKALDFLWTVNSGANPAEEKLTFAAD